MMAVKCPRATARRTERRSLPQADRMRWAAAFLILCGCSWKPQERLDLLFDSARDNLYTGELDRAQREAERGLQLAVQRHEPVFAWRFRLLRGQILLNSKRAEEVLRQLAEPLPAEPRFAALAARKLMLEGQAQSVLGHPGAA